MVVTWMTPTRAHRAGIGAQHTTQMRLAQTSWADRSPECTRPSFPQRAAVRLPPRRPQQQQRPQQHPPVAYYPAVQGMMQPMYRARTTMPIPVHQPGQGMMNFVGQQYPAPNAANAQMMQQPAQQAMPMMAPYYAPNQQPYHAPNQQQPGYF